MTDRAVITEQPQQTASVSTLPIEILLEIIPHVPFSPAQYHDLRKTSSAIATALANHEKSLVTAIRNGQMAAIDLATQPGLPPTWQGLNALHSRLATLATLNEQWSSLTVDSHDLSWLRARWLKTWKLGALLLYRLQDCTTHDARTDLLNALPVTSLACLYFNLYSSVKVLRLHGPSPINTAHCSFEDEKRADIEVATEELLLRNGVGFFAALLPTAREEQAKQHALAVSALEHEIATIEWQQLHSHVPTLISTLRRSFAAKMGCKMRENTTKMWEVLSGTVFDDLSDDVIIAVVSGEELKGGLRRMGLRRMGL